ncbi:MAG: zinc-ribbon domain-containing transport protein [Bacilli bacterium]|nr:zinc-ribbon domain-containing transport protein [Bacilli bacterium]
MTVEQLIQKDNSFSESGFISKVDNTFIMLLSAIMTDNMPRVKHKISDELYNKYTNYVNELNSKNTRQMYDELNVKSTHINEITEDEENYIIKVLLVSRYMDYLADKTTFKLISGNNTSRVEKDNILTFKKRKNAQTESSARVCPSCGANIDANSTGICPYCGSSYNTESYDWILTDIG